MTGGSAAAFSTTIDRHAPHVAGQALGGGEAFTIVRSDLATRDYTKACAACGKGEGEDGVHLRACAGCKRCRYCSVPCQVRGEGVAGMPINLWRSLAGSWLAPCSTHTAPLLLPVPPCDCRSASTGPSTRRSASCTSGSRDGRQRGGWDV